MNAFTYKNGTLHAENVSVAELAKHYGTPLYVYSRQYLETRWKAFDKAFGEHPHLICYAVKTNSNIAVLNVLAKLGAGFDIVSVGELERVLAAGGEPSKVVFSGVAKTEVEIERALEVGIHCFNVESVAELDRIQSVAARLDTQAPISLRVNPDVDAKTHPYISTGLKENKFGIDISIAPSVYAKAQQMPNIAIKGVDCHIGSQLTEIQPFVDALDRVLALVDELEALGITLSHMDLGGGLGIDYNGDNPPEIADYISALKHKLSDRSQTIILEPGRAIAGNAGILVSKVEFIKSNEEKNFAIIDAAMNDLIRPALYSAWQNIITVEQTPHGESAQYDLVGPVCETGDFLGKERELTLKPDDLIAVMSSGAYGFTMSSNYNSRPRAAEIMVDENQAHVIRQRETIESLFANESLMSD